MTTAPPVHADSARGRGLAGVFEIARRRRLLALLPFLFVLTAAASFAFFLPGLWTGRAVILVDRQQIPESFVKSTVTGDIESQLITLSQEILSRPRLARIIQEHNLYPKLRATHSIDEVVERLRRDIRLEPPTDNERRIRTRSEQPRTIAFTVAYTANDPRTAMLVTNKLASLYIEENVKFREKRAAGASEFLETQLAEIRTKLQGQERRVAEYKERHMGELPEQREANLRTLERLQQQLQLAYESNRRANERRQLITRSLAEIDQTTGLTSMAAGGLNVSPAEAAAARLRLLRQELAEMQSRYNDRYPDVIALKEQIRALEAKVAAESPAAQPKAQRLEDRGLRTAPQNPYIVSLMQQLDQANVEAKTTGEEIATLNRQLATYQKRIENTPKREQELTLITRDYESTREMFRSLLAKRGEAGIAADLEQAQKGEHFRVIEPASMPDRPTGPARMRMLLVGLVLGLGASAIAVVLAEQVDTSYRTVDQVRTSLPVPVLSTIPKITTERDRERAIRQRRLATAVVAVGLLVIVGSSFAVAHNNESLVAYLSQTDTGPARR